MEGTRNLEFVDRISNLPESLIHHILTFLDMKYVVQTSFLSRKWRYLWTSVDTLLFNSDEFFKEVDEDEDDNAFEIFVDRVLMLRGSSDIRKFDLFNYCYSPDPPVSKWILALVRHNVQEINIELTRDYPGVLRLPHCLVTSEFLTGLAIDIEGCIVLPDLISLPRLKSLSLISFEFGDFKVLNNLLSSCPVLQTLVIKQLTVHAGNELIVNTRELKHLEMSYFSYQCEEELYHVELPRIIKLNTPSLTSFICNDYMVRDYCLENISSLVAANVKMKKEDGDGDEELFRKRMLVFLMAFHNVKELTLSP